MRFDKSNIPNKRGRKREQIRHFPILFAATILTTRLLLVNGIERELTRAAYLHRAVSFIKDADHLDRLGGLGGNYLLLLFELADRLLKARLRPVALLDLDLQAVSDLVQRSHADVAVPP